MEKNVFKTYFGDKLDNDNSTFAGLVKRNKNGLHRKISYKMLGAKPQNQYSNSNNFKFKNVFDDVDLEYYVNSDKLKENIIVNKPVKNYSFTFIVEADNGIVLEESNGLVSFIDTYTKELLWQLERPYAEDSGKDEEKLISENVSYELTKVTYKGKEYNGISVVLKDEQFISNAKFPITIDPTTVNQGVFMDAYVTSGSPSSNYGSSSELVIGSNPSKDIRYTFIKPTLPYIPPNALIDSASVNLCISYNTSGSSSSCYVYMCTSDWNQSTIRFSSMPTIEGERIHSSSLLNPDSNQFVAITIRTAVRRWYAGETNYGVRLSLFNAGEQYCKFNSSDSSNTLYKPYMTIVYRVPPHPPTNITATKKANQLYTISWNASVDEDTNQSNLTYGIELSNDNGTNWHTILSSTSPGVTSYDYDFGSEPESAYTKVRVRPYDNDCYGDWGYSNNFIIDRTNPSLAATVSSDSQSITMSAAATDNTAGLDTYPYRYIITQGDNTIISTSWINSSSYTKGSLFANTRYGVFLEVRDLAGNTSSYSNNIYTKAAVPTLTVNNPTSYTLDVSTTDVNPTLTQYQLSINNGVSYVTPEGTLTSSPVWFTLTDKRITVKGLNPSTSYTFKVKAKNEEGIETVLSSPVSGTTLIAPPAPPANLIATATSDTITVSWDAASTATGYDIEVDGSIVNTGTSMTYTHIGLVPGTPHTFRVRGKNAGGPGNWSNQISKSTLPANPDVPVNLSAVPQSTSITVTWNNVPGATGYDIEVDGKLEPNGPNTSYIHSSLTPGTYHTYRVRSINAGGKSDWSNQISTATLLDSSPVPVNLEAVPSYYEISITWDPVDGASGYEIEVDDVRIDTNTRTSYTHSGLAPGTEHSYRVRAKNGTVMSDWTSVLVVTTLYDSFGAPANIKAVADDTEVRLSWDRVPEAEGYDVEADDSIIDNGSETSCIHSGLSPNTTYTYRVRAKSQNAESDWSEPITITTFALPKPTILFATSDDYSITTVWQAVYDAVYYDVEVDGSIILDISDTMYTCDGFAPNTQHVIRVRAKNDDGQSNWSTPLIKSTLFNGYTVPNISGIARKDSITLIWNSVDDAQGYDLEADGTVINNIESTTYMHSGLEPGSEHTYRIRIADSLGEDSWSSVFNVITLSETPAVPTNIVASASTTSITISWDQVLGAEEYDIEVDGVIVSTGAGTSYLHSGLSPDTQHTYKVRSKNIGGCSEWSQGVTVKTVSSVQTYNVSCTAGEVINLVLSASNIQDINSHSFTVSYNQADFDVVDLCGFTPRIDLSTGAITGTDINVIQFTEGTIVFTKNSSGNIKQVWSGAVNSIKLKAKNNVQAVITYSFN